MNKLRSPFAVLIDGENIGAQHVKHLLDLINKLGRPAIFRAYGDFSKESMKPWSEAAGDHGLAERHVAVRTSGKNAVDMAMAIDATELATEGRSRDFVLVSSDGDFCELALKLRERGCFVLGIGEDNAPDAFRKACSAFERLEAPAKAVKQEPKPEAPKIVPKNATPAPAPVDSETATLVREILEKLAKNELMPLSVLGTEMRKRDFKIKGRLITVLKRMDDVYIHGKANQASACLKKAS